MPEHNDIRDNKNTESSVFTKTYTKSITLYHASDKIINPEDIRFPGPRENCDFGSGFYLTEDKRIAEEWGFRLDSPVINVFEYTPSNLSSLHLEGEDWIRVILGFRKRLLNTHFTSNVIYGLIADDRLFPSLDLFLEGTIGDKRLEKCLSFVNLGKQYCFKNSVEGLVYQRSYTLKGLEKQNASERSRDRKRGMDSGLRDIIQNQPSSGEKFIQHHEEMGDWHEV